MSQAVSTSGSLLSVIVNPGSGSPAECGVTYIESLDLANPAVLRELDSGSYVLYGKFKAYSGDDTIIVFESKLNANIVKSTDCSSIMIFNPVNSKVECLTIYDDRYERTDVALQDVVAHIGQLKNDIDSKPQFGDLYDGVDLTIKHATEIADYESPWAWIKARIVAGNFSQLHVGDYIPFTTTNGRTFQAQIAGINTYKGYGDSEVGNHIDFITRDLWPDYFKMNLVNFNNGTEDTKQVPWIASNGYMLVNSLAGQVPNSTTKPLEMTDVDYTSGGIYFYLPDDLKAVIIEKRVFAPTRYSASGVLTKDNSGAWVNLGKLWLPDECEVTGARQMTTTGWFSGGYVQYPIFAGNMNRVKRANGSRCIWWLSSADTANSTRFVIATNQGQVNSSGAIGVAYAPLCFRVS